MLRLTTFGGVALTLNERPVIGAAAGRRRRALLALLAASGPRGIDREVLAELLWPNSDRARHSLDQLLSEMRQGFGTPQLFVGAPTLHLNPDCITTDVRDFEAALHDRRPERAVALYAGPFAKDLMMAGAAELHRRLDELRATYARQYATALETLAREAGARGDTTAAVRWWRLLAEAEPFSARVAKELIDAYVAAGERLKALEFALVHEALVAQELGLAPDPEILQWIRRLRAEAPVVPDDEPAPPVRRSRPASGDRADEDIEAAERRRLAHLTSVIGGRYQITARLEEGSIAARYSAVLRDAAPQDVEVHVIHPRIAAFANEAHFTEVLGRVVALADRHIHPVIDFRAAEATLFYVTTRRAGMSLRRRLRQDGELPIREAIGFARDVAAALAHAHARGVRHGDLRPKHIALGSGGAVVSALGIIEAISGDHEPHADDSTIVTLGSPTYLSPEQISNRGLTNPRHDVYAFGCIVYEMLAGDPPFGRSLRGSGLAGKLNEPAPRLRCQRDTVPQALDEIVARCLARVPADRYSSGGELVRALAEVPTDQEPTIGSDPN